MNKLEALIKNHQYQPKLDDEQAAFMLLQIGLAGAEAFTTVRNQFGKYPRKDDDPEAYRRFRDQVAFHRERKLEIPRGTFVPAIDKDPRSKLNQTIQAIQQTGDVSKAEKILPKLAEIYHESPADFDKLAKTLGYLEVQ